MSGSGDTERREQVRAFGQRHRSGVVTLLFTDIVGSTQLKRMIGDAAGVALIQQHHALVRELLKTAPDAQEISTAGDSFFLVFTRVSAAVQFALQLQNRLHAAAATAPYPVRDRIGIHLGEAVEDQHGGRRDLLGLEVDTAAAVMSLAQGDQIFLTSAAYQTAISALHGDRLPGLGEIRWVAHGRCPIKEGEHSVEIFEVGELGVAPFTPPRARTVPPGARAPETELVVPPTTSYRFLVTCLAVALLLALVSLLLPRRTLPVGGDEKPLPTHQRLVVLPFKGGTNDAMSADFCRGLAHIIASQLTRLGGRDGWIQVVPMADVFAEDIQTVGAARDRFGATLVISGDLVTTGPQRSLIIGLHDAKTMVQRSSDRFDLGPEYLSKLQELIANRSASWLGLRLPTEPANAPGRGTNSAAYEAYLSGMGALMRVEAREVPREAMRYFQEATILDDGLAPAHARLAESYVLASLALTDTNLLVPARNSAARAAALEPARLETHLALGNLLLAERHTNEALAAFQRALEVNPFSPEASDGLARGYILAGNNSLAEQAYRQATRRNPDYWPAFRDLGTYYSQVGHFTEAKECFSNVIRLAPGSARGFSSLGAILYLEGDLDGAIVQFEKSLGIRPTAEAHSNLGTCDFFRGRFAESAGHFRQAAALKPNSITVAGNLADALRWSRAAPEPVRAAYRKAVELSLAERDAGFDSPENRAERAWYQLSLGETNRALETITAARGDAPSNLNVMFFEVLVREGATQRREALESLASALKAGYPKIEAENHPALAGLRSDPRFAAIRADSRSPQ